VRELGNGREKRAKKWFQSLNGEGERTTRARHGDASKRKAGNKSVSVSEVSDVSSLLESGVWSLESCHESWKSAFSQV
jgi:hypothetical protein